jgi:hypothetical protein
MIPTENKNTIHFKQRLLMNCLPHNLEILTVNGGDSTNQYHIQLTVAKFTGNRKKIKSGYFIATPRTSYAGIKVFRSLPYRPGSQINAEA